MPADQAALWIGIVSIIVSIVVPLGTARATGSVPRWLWTAAVFMIFVGGVFALAGSMSAPATAVPAARPDATVTASPSSTPQSAEADSPPPGSPLSTAIEPSPSLPAYAGEEVWSGAGQVRFAQSQFDFDSAPAPGRYGVGADLDSDGMGLRTERSGKVVEWGGSQMPSPQQCYEAVATSPAKAQYIAQPEVGRWYCLVTDKGLSAGRIVAFRITQLIPGGVELQATVWAES